MNNKNIAVKASGIDKTYKIYSNPNDKLLDLILPKGIGKEFKALKDINFEVAKGEIVGIIGLNGAGKSTLSNIIGGISIPSNGNIVINGESSIIAIGLGLNNFLTGIENINVKATMMGYKKAEINKITKDVIEFAEIGEFINQPIRTYSSGMRARLGFGIAVNMNPDILVIDEALSVGDPTFTNKCLKKMNEFKENGKTIFFVSHSIPQIREFCTKVMWLEYGGLKDFGDVNEILPKYSEYINMINAMTEKEKEAYKSEVLKFQKHELLNRYNHKFLDFKKIDSTGKIFKRVTIRKDNKFKSIIYNFDVFTAIFGFIPSLFRKDLGNSCFIFIAQGINLFIMEWPVVLATNFVITFAFSFLSGKRYIKRLVLKKDFSISSLNDKSTYINNKKQEKLRVIQENEKLERERQLEITQNEIKKLKEAEILKKKELEEKERLIAEENYKKFIAAEQERKNKAKLISDKEKLLYEQKIKTLQSKIESILEEERIRAVTTKFESIKSIEATINKDKQKMENKQTEVITGKIDIKSVKKENISKDTEKNIFKRTVSKKKHKKVLIFTAAIIGSLLAGGVYYSYFVNLKASNKNHLGNVADVTPLPVMQEEVVNNELNLNSFVHLIIDPNDSKSLASIRSLCLFNYDNHTQKLTMTIYPGDLLLKSENESGDILSKMIDYKDFENTKKLLLYNFNHKVDNFLVSKIGSDENFKLSMEYHTAALNKIKKDGLVEETFKENEIASSFEYEELKKFYDEVKINIKETELKAVNYKEKNLGEYCKEKKLQLPSIFDSEHIFIYIEESAIESTKILEQVRDAQ